MSRLLRDLFLALVALFMIGPLVVIAGISVNSRRFLSFPPKGFSFRWYAEIVVNDAWFDAVKNSLTVATLSSLLSVSIALPIAYSLWRHRLLYARALYALGVAPFVLPPVIMALAFLLFWTTAGHHGQLENVIISHAVFLVALPLITISLGLESIEREVIEAAQTMGANEVTVFRTVTFPMVRPYVVSGYAFAFVLSLNEYIIAFMTVGFTMETLPIKIFNSLRYGYTPVMGSVAVMFVVLAALIFGLIGRFGDLPKLLGAWSPKEDQGPR